MKSISEVTGNVMTNLETSKVASAKLSPRLAPLETVDIEKMDAAVSRSFFINREPVYGYLAIRDNAGNIIRSEYDIVANRETYIPKGDVPTQLRDAMLRPAERRHIIFHLTRLAAHLRDTRGKEALSAVLEDIAFDLDGVSEWAVVISCREMRQKEKTWYPSTGEILKIVREHNDRIGQIVASLPTALQITSEGSKREPAPAKIDRNDKPRSAWSDDDWREYVEDAEKMLATAREYPHMLSIEVWEKEVADRAMRRTDHFASITGAG